MFILLLTTPCLAQVYEGDLTLGAQADVDAFRYAKVTGDLTIEGPAISNLDSLVVLKQVGERLSIRFNNNLTNLHGLASLAEVGGEVSIQGNDMLTDLNGLNTLEHIGGSLGLSDNDHLKTLDGLTSLQTIEGHLMISNHTQLTSIQGLSALSSIPGDLFIWQNWSLADVDGLSALSSIGGGIRIGGNTNLQNIDGLSALTFVGGFILIRGNQRLTNLDGLSALDTVEFIEIDDNALLVDVSGLSSLTSIPSYLSISHNKALASIDGLTSLTAVGGLAIYGNPVLVNVNGLSGLASVADAVNINGNPSLTSLQGLRNIATIGHGLLLADNDALTSLDGLSGIRSLGNDPSIASDVVLLIRDNDALVDISGLSGITSIGEGLTPTTFGGALIRIENNDALTRIDGLPAMGTVGGDLIVTDNDALLDLDGMFAVNTIRGDLTIANNGALIDVDGLSAVRLVEGDLTVTDNGALTLCGTGLCGLLTSGFVKGETTIEKNAPGCDSPAEFESQCTDDWIITLIWPEDGASSISTVANLLWSESLFADRYVVEVSTDSDFGSVFFRENVPAAHAEFVAPAVGETYYWRARVAAPGGGTPWSRSRHFTVGSTGSLVVDLLSPADGSGNQYRAVDLRWTPAPMALKYHLQVSESSDFDVLVTEKTALTDTAFHVIGLKGGTQYFWRAAGVDDRGRETFSPSWSFTTVVNAPGQVALSQPSPGATGVSLSPVFSWAAIESAIYYQLQVAIDSSMLGVIVNDSALSRTSQSLAEPLLFGTTYYWRVRARNAGGNGAWSETRTFSTVVAAPDAVVLLAPANETKGVAPSPVFYWMALESALSYQMQIASDSLMAALVVNDSALTEPNDSLQVILDYESTYYWHVRANNIGGDGPWSSVWSFKTQVAAPAAVTLGSPENGATGVAPYATVVWQSVEDASAYHIQLASSPAFTAPVVDDSLLVESSMVLSDPLSYGTTFYWHVRAGRDDGLGKTTGIVYGPWSETRSFTVAIGTAIENGSSIPSEFALHPAYPNPFNPSTTISFDVPEATTVRLAVFDALGRLVESIVDGQLSAGTHQVTWKPAGKPSGAYFVRMTAGTFSATSRMLLAK